MLAVHVADLDFFCNMDVAVRKAKMLRLLMMMCQHYLHPGHNIRRTCSTRHGCCRRVAAVVVASSR